MPSESSRGYVQPDAYLENSDMQYLRSLAITSVALLGIGTCVACGPSATRETTTTTEYGTEVPPAPVVTQPPSSQTTTTTTTSGPDGVVQKRSTTTYTPAP